MTSWRSGAVALSVGMLAIAAAAPGHTTAQAAPTAGFAERLVVFELFVPPTTPSGG